MMQDSPADGEARKAGDETAKAREDLRLLFKNSDVEVIHSHLMHLAVKAADAGNKIGVPCVYTHHRYKGFKPPRLGFPTITVSRNSFEQLKSSGFPEDDLYYIPSGTKVIPRVTSESNHPSLVWVGRLEYIKGPDLAILAMAVLKRRYGSECPELNVYGEGSLDGHLKDIVSALDLGDKVRFHGVQPGILERCPATNILVMSSREEAGPLVAVEAISRGMPIVATLVGEIEQIIPDRRYGHIVLNGSIISLADGIGSMLSDVRAGRFEPGFPIERHLALYTVEKMAERVDSVYRNLINRSVSVALT
jgi:glycosyltransferase involved in cell wall biosynthesis